MCKPHHVATVYHEVIVSDVLMKKENTIFYEKMLYISVEVFKIVVAHPIASIACAPVSTIATATGPITGVVVGASCYIGTVSAINSIIPSTEVTILEDDETINLHYNQIMHRVTETICDAFSLLKMKRHYFFYIVKQKTFDDKNDLQDLMIEEEIKIDQQIDVTRLNFVPIILSKDLDYKVGFHRYDKTEVIFMYADGTKNIYLIKRLVKLY